MKLKLFAPVDCEVKSITECDDEMFAQKMMGDGLVIIPKKNNFNSFLETGKVALIFETKHALFFEVNQIKILMHVGMDTVKLNGAPFNIFVKEKEKINLASKILDVDLEILKQEKLSNQTAICFDNENIKTIKIEIINKKAKQGEQIAEVDIELKDKPIKDDLLITPFESKYWLIAKQLIENVGGFANYSKVYNCMTRVRFLVKDINAVDVKKIKKIDLVKGINFNGQELQVIIGGECYKVKEEVEKIQVEGMEKKVEVKRDDIKKPPLMKRMMTVISGIMMPQIPALMAVGIFGAIYAILLQANIIEDFEKSANPDVWSTTFYVLSKVGLNLIGVLFCYSTVAYFGGSPILAIMVGLTLASRIFLEGVATPVTDPGFGDFVQAPGVSGWLLFKIGNYPIVVRAYEGSVLPYIFGAVLVILSDKWVKKWMPTSVDIIFRPFLVYAFAVLPTLFMFGPILGLVEMLLSKGIIFLEKDVTGIGVALFAFLWQILVLTGVHVAIITTIMIGTILQNPVIPTTLLSVVVLATFAQLGAVLAVIVRTKNAQLRGIALGAIPAAIFGITEPIIYGVNLPKIRPFLCACAGAFVGGLFIKWFNLPSHRAAGMGVFGIMWVDGIKNQLLFVLTWGIGIGAAFGFTMLTYKEKVDELAYSKKIVQKLSKTSKKILMVHGMDEQTAKNTVISISEKYLSQLKENYLTFKMYMKYLGQKSKIETKLTSIKGKEEKIKKTKFGLALRAKANIDKLGIEKVKAVIKDYHDYNLDDIKTKLLNELEVLEKNSLSVVTDYQNLVKNLTQAYELMVDEFVKVTKTIPLKNYGDGLFNAINSSEINYGIIDPLPMAFSKTEKQNLKMMQNVQK